MTTPGALLRQKPRQPNERVLSSAKTWRDGQVA